MDKAEPTPGPWRIQFGGMEGDDHFTITSKISPGAVADYAVAAPRPWREVQANAQLISAAPDLLKACRLALACERREPDHDFAAMREALEAALAKAEGR